MIKIAICDDNEKDIEKVLTTLNTYLEEESLDANVETFSHPDDLITKSEEKGFDIYILDIVMPMLTGIDVGKSIRKSNNKAVIIYLTSSNEYAVDAFSVKATHYLMKPCTLEQLRVAMERALSEIDIASSRQLSVTTKSGEIHCIDIDEICYIESNNHDIYIVQEEATLLIRSSLSIIKKELEDISPRQFISPYKGYIVNQKKILWISRDTMTIKGGFDIPIPKRNYKILQKEFENYVFGGGDKCLK